MIDLQNINHSLSKTMNLPYRNYTHDRNLAAIIVEEIRISSPQVVSEFNKQIRKWMKSIKQETGNCGPADFLLFITPLEICEAALSAIQQCMSLVI